MWRVRPVEMSRKQQQLLADALCRVTKRFNRHEVLCLMKVFSTLVDTFPEQHITVGLDRNKFRNVLHVTFGMTDDMIMDRVFRAFDKDNDSYVNMKEWIEGLSIFLRGTLDEKIKWKAITAQELATALRKQTAELLLYKQVLAIEHHSRSAWNLFACSTKGNRKGIGKHSVCFDVFDLNGDGFISREEMFHMLKTSLVKQPTEEDPDEGVKDLVEIALKKLDYDHDNKVSCADFEKAVKDENLLLEAFGPCLPDPKSALDFEKQSFKKSKDD